jgi:hypothetical protein
VLWSGWLQKEYTTVSVTVGGEDFAGASAADARLAAVNTAGETQSTTTAATTPTQILLDDVLTSNEMTFCPSAGVGRRNL